MDYVIRINTGNAAFGDSLADVGLELARMLRQLADQIEARGPVATKLRDSNGNTVGEARFLEEEVSR